MNTVEPIKDGQGQGAERYPSNQKQLWQAVLQ